MDAYDAAVLSYALATSTVKGRPPNLGLLGAAPGVPNASSSPKEMADNTDPRRYLYQLLYNMNQMIMNKISVPFSLLMDLCTLRRDEGESVIVTSLEVLLTELRLICKSNPSAIHLLSFNFEDENLGTSLNTEKMCKALSDLFRQFGLHNSSNAIKQHIENPHLP